MRHVVCLHDMLRVCTTYCSLHDILRVCTTCCVSARHVACLHDMLLVCTTYCVPARHVVCLHDILRVCTTCCVSARHAVCLHDISKDIHLFGGIICISHVPVIIRIDIFVVLLTCIFKECNDSVDLILWLVVYVIFRTIYALDKFSIQWLYYQ